MFENILGEFAPSYLYAYPGAGGVKRRVLVVEDDFCMRPILTQILYSLDHTTDVAWVSSLSEARTALGKKEYGLVIADYLLRNAGTGMDLWLHCRAYHPQVPVIMISGLSLEKLRAQSGVLDARISYLPKPIPVAQCQRLIENAFGATDESQ